MNPDQTRTEAGTMILLARLAKQAMRRSDPELLGIDLRLLMALSGSDDIGDVLAFPFREA